MSTSAQLFAAEWASSSGGKWIEPSNWNTPLPPDGKNDVARILSAPFEDATISLENEITRNITVGELEINNPNKITIGRANDTPKLVFSADPSPAQLTFLTPNNEIVANVRLDSDIEVSVDIGASITDSSTISGNISESVLRSEMLTKLGLATLTLSGANNYSGGTHLLEGTIVLENSAGLGTGELILFDFTTLVLKDGVNPKNDITVVGNSTINVSNGAGTILGQISGLGNLKKEGSGSLALTSINTYSGVFSLDQGSLILENQTILPASALTVANGTFLLGNGTIGNSGALTNSGTVAPGASIGTIFVDGSYTQNGDGKLFIEIDSSGATDLLAVSGVPGTAALDGTLEWEAAPGVYRPNQQFTFLTAAGGRSGVFRNEIEDHPFLNFDVIYGANFAALVIDPTGGGFVLPVPIDDLPLNARRVANYLFPVEIYPRMKISSISWTTYSSFLQMSLQQPCRS